MQSKSSTSCQCCTVPSQQPHMPSHWYKLLDIHAEPDSCVELHRIRRRRSFCANSLNSTLSAGINIADESYRSKSEYFSKYSNLIHPLPSLCKDNLVCSPCQTHSSYTRMYHPTDHPALFVDGQISTNRLATLFPGFALNFDPVSLLYRRYRLQYLQIQVVSIWRCIDYAFLARCSQN